MYQRCTCEKCKKIQERAKRKRGKRASLETVASLFLRPDLMNILDKYWEMLKVQGLFADQSREPFQWSNASNSPVYVQRRQYHLILRNRRSEDLGAMWLHMMLSWGFNHRYSLPFSQLRHHIGDEKWDQLEEPFFETEEMDKFTEQKIAQKEQYEQDLERTKADMADVDNQTMTAEEFVATL